MKMNKIHMCLNCGKSWKIQWNKNKNKLPKYCKFCKSAKWNVQKCPNSKDLLKLLINFEKNKK